MVFVLEVVHKWSKKSTDVIVCIRFKSQLYKLCDSGQVSGLL